MGGGNSEQAPQTIQTKSVQLTRDEELRREQIENNKKLMLRLKESPLKKQVSVLKLNEKNYHKLEPLRNFLLALYSLNIPSRGIYEIFKKEIEIDV